MEVFMKGEDGLRQHQGFTNSGDDHLDFDDVFGGPPRRFLTAEKPVFGGERRRHLPPGDRFFDDIFRGDESSLRPRRDRHNLFIFGTTSKTQPCSSLPARSSVPAKLTKVVELPTFCPRAHVEHKKKDGSSNGLSSPNSSRYSVEELRYEVFPKMEKDGRSISNRYHFIAADSRPKTDVKKQSQSFRWTAAPTKQKENNQLFLGKMCFQVDENLREVEPKQCPQTKTADCTSNQAYSSESVSWDSKILGEDSDEDYFVLQELCDDLEQATTPRSEACEDTKALDAKIQQWSAGKKGNIRSLLSTLQYVLWAGSEWKAIALVDLVEANPVKRAYQKALLRLHPDKLQQKGAASNHKYIAEKVFEILQEAWDHFNNVAPI